ncbi:hypothetical protein RM844_14695 [Streptomyces sp. DSM 44915]|uniref:Uncharacterized protein n=1 Tax=Streptomyces chisholmiae TaxID=3075540 RepID=A0ABU2JRD6_9ACTN|nr:hypothetical protein [Streptomyces sp. DSM 44915]MDT0267536.1 hypothetical protein [Streptomyces sp. DSM 44915]
MNRTPLPEHALKRTPYNQIFAALMLTSLVGAYVLLGGIGFGIALALWIAGLIFYGRAFGKRSFEMAMRQREQDEASHQQLLRERARHAAREGMTYEEQSVELAALYGRVKQDVPESTRLPFRPRARHTAELTAEGVVRGERGGFPSTIFDLAVVNEVDLSELRRRGQFDRAVECAKDYLTVCAVTLPFALPYLSAQAAWEYSDDGSGEFTTPRKSGALEPTSEQRHSDDPQFARMLLSVPAVREAAQKLDLLWVIWGDQLIASKLSNTGLAPDEAFRRLGTVAALAAAFPWGQLAQYRQPKDAVAALPALWGPPRSPLLAHQWWHGEGPDNPWVLRWGHQPLGATGLHQLSSVGLFLDGRRTDL